MSGHSHWSTIKRKKGAADAQRSRIFSKMARIITVAARKGKDPIMNPALRFAIDKAKEANMPKDNIERAVKRGAGELEGAELEEFAFEAMGPGNIAIIIEGITDNKNRALNEIKRVLKENNAKLVQTGSVKWLFERKGIIEVRSLKNEEGKKEDLELKVIEAGAEDIVWHEDYLSVITKAEEVETVRSNLEKAGLTIESASSGWVEKTPVSPTEKTREGNVNLFEALDELEDVQEIYSNLKI